MKILQVNCVYGTGSTGKITAVLHHAMLDQGIDSVVCYGRGAAVQEARVYQISNDFYGRTQHFCNNITGLMYGGCGLSTRKLFRIIERENPDVVHLHCINCYSVNIYRLIEYLKTHHIRTVLTLHAEFMYTANCGYALECDRWLTGCGKCPRLKKETGSYLLDNTAKSWQLMKHAFDGFDDDLWVVSVSPWLMERAKRSPILKDKRHLVVLNGLDTAVFHLYDTSELQKQYNPDGRKIIFHATQVFNTTPGHIKGAEYVLQLAERLKNENVRFIVAGPHDPQLQVPDNVVLLGNVSNQKLLAQMYSMADVTLLTSKKETFSMICAESLCCGTPMVGFKAGAPEMISLPAFSKFVPHGDVDALQEQVMRRLQMPAAREEIAAQAKQAYAEINMVTKYLNLYRNVMES